VPTFDPVASLRMWAVEVEVGGITLRIPPLPASDWLPFLMSADILGTLDLAEDVDIEGMLIDGVVSIDVLREALERLVESAAGRSSWVAMVIAHTASAHWHVVGADLARAGMRFIEIPLGAALDAMYGSLIRAMDEKGIKQFNDSLDRGPVTSAGPAVPRALAERPLPASAAQYVRVRPRTRLRRPQGRQPGPPASPMPTPPPLADSGRQATVDVPGDALPPAASPAPGTESLLPPRGIEPPGS
jgi:hypothetical protein